MLELDFRSAEGTANSARAATASGIHAQSVILHPGAAYDFNYVGKSHFLAFHQLRLKDGETFADDTPAVRPRDARATFTFIPAGCRVWGWSATSGRDNSFLALYMDPESLRQELDGRLHDIAMQPELFFAAPAIVAEVTKLQDALGPGAAIDPLYVETLSVLVATEFCRHRERRAPDDDGSGRVGNATIARVDEYIRENLEGPIALEDLARLSGLSRFHFLRAFKTSTGETPYRRVVRLRIERARELLGAQRASVAEVARRVGYGSPSRFIEAFRRTCGITPGEYLATLRTPASRDRR